MSDAIWETFEALFKTVHRQGRMVEELEGRVAELERRLKERARVVEGTAEPPARLALVETGGGCEQQG